MTKRSRCDATCFRDFAGNPGISLSQSFEERLHGPPDLAVEILSASNAERDRIVKRDLYRQYGVPEYWIVDPDAQTIEVLSLESGEWRLHGIFGKSEELASPILPGLRLSLEQVFV